MLKEKQKKMFTICKMQERGDGGISYAMYFVAIVTALIMFVFLKFNADLYMIEEALENGLHIAENRALTATQDKIGDDSFREDTYERELSRMHIVTRYSTTSQPEIENSQVQLIATDFSNALKEQLDLNGSHPNSRILKSMCGSDADILIEKLTIYEPVYQKTVTKVSNGLIEGTSLEAFDFTINYNVVNWIVYEVDFDNNNNFSSFTKTVKTGSDTPTLANGNAAEGATLEATIGTKFKGIRNIFAGVQSTPPTVVENYYEFGEAYNNLTADGYDISDSVSPIFSSNPTQLEYAIKVTQAVDIVVAHQDFRKQQN